MSVTSLVFGSYMARCRSLVARGKSFADALLDPSLQKSGLSLGRTLDVNHARPSSSNIGLCTLAPLLQIASSPQYGEGADMAVKSWRAPGWNLRPVPICRWLGSA